MHTDNVGILAPKFDISTNATVPKTLQYTGPTATFYPNHHLSSNNPSTKHLKQPPSKMPPSSNTPSPPPTPYLLPIQDPELNDGMHGPMTVETMSLDDFELDDYDLITALQTVESETRQAEAALLDVTSAPRVVVLQAEKSGEGDVDMADAHADGENGDVGEAGEAEIEGEKAGKDGLPPILVAKHRRVAELAPTAPRYTTRQTAKKRKADDEMDEDSRQALELRKGKKRSG